MSHKPKIIILGQFSLLPAQNWVGEVSTGGHGHLNLGFLETPGEFPKDTSSLPPCLPVPGIVQHLECFLNKLTARRKSSRNWRLTCPQNLVSIHRPIQADKRCSLGRSKMFLNLCPWEEGYRGLSEWPWKQGVGLLDLHTEHFRKDRREQKARLPGGPRRYCGLLLAVSCPFFWIGAELRSFC